MLLNGSVLYYLNKINSSSYGSFSIGYNGSIAIDCGFKPGFVAIQNQGNGQFGICSNTSYNLNNSSSASAGITITNTGFVVTTDNSTGRVGTYHYVACQ